MRSDLLTSHFLKSVSDIILFAFFESLQVQIQVQCMAIKLKPQYTNQNKAL